MSAAENTSELEGRDADPSGSGGQAAQDALGKPGQSQDPEERAAAELALRVFRGDERWGWEFVQPPEPPAHRDAQNPPVYTEPSDVEVRTAYERAMSGRKTTGFGCLTLIAGGVALVSIGLEAAIIVVALVIALIVATSPKARLRAAQRRLQSAREQAQRDYHARWQAWQHSIEAHRAEHLRHNETLDTWYPISSPPAPAGSTSSAAPATAGRASSPPSADPSSAAAARSSSWTSPSRPSPWNWPASPPAAV